MGCSLKTLSANRRSRDGQADHRGRRRYALNITKNSRSAPSASPAALLPRQADGRIQPVLCEVGGWYLFYGGTNPLGHPLGRWFDVQDGVLFPAYPFIWQDGWQPFEGDLSSILNAGHQAEELRRSPVVVQHRHRYLLQVGGAPYRGLEPARVLDVGTGTLSEPATVNSFFKMGLIPWCDFNGDPASVLAEAARATKFELPPQRPWSGPRLTTEELRERSRRRWHE